MTRPTSKEKAPGGQARGGGQESTGVHSYPHYTSNWVKIISLAEMQYRLAELNLEQARLMAALDSLEGSENESTPRG